MKLPEETPQVNEACEMHLLRVRELKSPPGFEPPYYVLYEYTCHCGRHRAFVPYQPPIIRNALVDGQPEQPVNNPGPALRGASVGPARNAQRQEERNVQMQDANVPVQNARYG